MLTFRRATERACSFQVVSFLLQPVETGSGFT
jgi:hypothetical protein